jgi:KUP system potassium uptake protein
MTVEQSRTPASAGDDSGVSAPEHHGHGKGSVWTMTLGSIGVVYGDIGTSPLYALKTAMEHARDHSEPEAAVIGIVSLLIWALFFVVTVKYVFFMMRADNKGEGGTLSLMALAQKAVGRRSRPIFLLGVAGAALFTGDAIITPAISVLSAVEGLNVVSPVFKPYVLPIAVVILVGLFAVQKHGTARVATFFGPIMVVFFGLLAWLGLTHISDDPRILNAFNPTWGLSFLFGNGAAGFVTLGLVFLAVTGAEALYADMGHFGRRPIQIAWLVFVLPALVLNYLGQGALILKDPGAMKDPFYLMAPEMGANSLRHAGDRRDRHRQSGRHHRRILADQSGDPARPAAAHGNPAHVGDDGGPDFRAARQQAHFGRRAAADLHVQDVRQSRQRLWHRRHRDYGRNDLSRLLRGLEGMELAIVDRDLFIGFFLIIDVAFLAANFIKVLEGGWVPLLLAVAAMVTMWTWVRGTQLLFQKTHRDSIPTRDLIRMLEKSKPMRAPGTAIFLTSDPEVAPSALMHNIKHNHVVHARVIIMNVVTEPIPRVAADKRFEIEDFSADFKKITLHYGFMESPRVPAALATMRKAGVKFDIMTTSFFLGKRTLKTSPTSGMPGWQDSLYVALSRQSANATDFFSIPSDRVVELGAQVTI